MRNKYLSFVLLLSVLLYACQNNSQPDENTMPPDNPATSGITSTPAHPDGYSTRTDVTPPLEQAQVPVKTFKVDASKGDVIEIENTGTTIEIPASAFVDANGQPIEGEVDIQFREFHTVADILASGIPMQLTAPDGSTGYMQSAGMFDLQGSADGKPIFVKEETPLTVNLASYHDDGDYDFWQLDQETKQWLNKGPSAKPTANPAKEEARTFLRKVKDKIASVPVKPYRFDSKKPVLEFEINLENFPELKEMGAVMWQYAGSDDKLDPVKNPWVLRENWDAADVEPYSDGSNLYRLTLRNAKKEFITTVCPSQSGEEFKQSMAEYSAKAKEYEKNKVSQAEMQELVKQQADLLRSFRISGFGVYNYDIMFKDDDFIPLLVDFDFGDLMIPGLRKFTTVYMVTDNRNVVKYPVRDWDKVRINPNADTKMVAILPGGRYATLSSEEIAASMGAIRAASGKKYTFKMHVEGMETIANMNHLRQILDRLV